MTCLLLQKLYLHSLLYLNLKIKNRVFLIKITDYEGQAFETIVSNKQIIYLHNTYYIQIYIRYILYMFIYFMQRTTSMISLCESTTLLIFSANKIFSIKEETVCLFIVFPKYFNCESLYFWGMKSRIDGVLYPFLDCLT